MFLGLFPAVVVFLAKSEIYSTHKMTHWLPGVVSRDMARELEYGDKACYENVTDPSSDITCGDFEDKTR